MPHETSRITLTAQPPDELLPVIRLELDGPPDHDASRVIGAADVFPDLLD